MPVTSKFINFIRRHTLPPLQGSNFSQEFNSHRVSEKVNVVNEESCHKAGRLFNKNKSIKEDSANEK